MNRAIPSAAVTAALNAIERATVLTRAVRQNVESGRLDLLELDVQARSDAVDTVQESLNALDGPRPEAVARAFDEFRTVDRALIEWMEAEKKATAIALGSIRGQRVDPYREQLVGPSVLNHHS